MAAKIRTASSPSRKTIIDESKTTVPALRPPDLGRVHRARAGGGHEVDRGDQQGSQRGPHHQATPAVAGVATAELLVSGRHDFGNPNRHLPNWSGLRPAPRAREGAPPDGRPCAMEGPGGDDSGGCPHLGCGAGAQVYGARRDARHGAGPADTRERTLALVAHLSDADLERAIDPIMSPLVWDLAPHRRLRGPLARPPPRRPRRCCTPSSPRSTTRSRRRARCAATSSCSTPRGRARLPRRGARARSLDGARRARASTGPARAGPAPRAAAHRDDAPDDGARRAARRRASRRCAALGGRARRWVDDPRRRPFAMGAGDGGLRLRQRAPAPRGRRARLPRSPAARSPTRSWLHFSEGGGYERREWWSDEGWAWKEEYDIDAIRRGRRATRTRPSCHVSWFEADAFARAHGARLPDRGRVGEGGDLEPATAATACGHRPGVGVDAARASAATRASSPTPTASTPRSSSATATASCAAARGRPHPRVATATFRNWDLPAAPPDLRRRAAGAAMRSRRSTAADRRADPIDRYLGRRRRALARRRRRSTGSRARSRSCRPSTSTTRAAPSCSTASASCPSTTRRAPSARSSRHAPRRSPSSPAPPSSSSSGSGTAAKTRVLLDAMHDAGTLRRYVPST